jgi:hypothetical protein
MRTTRILMAAVAATLLSTASFAVPPSAAQVSVPAGTTSGKMQGKMKALFASPEERMMFRVQMREATHGMARKDKKAWRKQQFQKIRAMNDSQKADWRHGLDAQWAALPADRRDKIEAHVQRHEERHEAHMGHRHGQTDGQDMSQQPPQQQQ